MDIDLFGEVGWEIRADSVSESLKAADGGDVVIHLNSGGGDAYEGIAVMNLLRSHPGQVTVIVEGLAASAASIIACGGADTVVMRPNAELMVHDAWTFTDGNAADLTKKVEDLERTSQGMAEVYAARAGGAADEWRERMRAETWFSAQEAVDAGLVDEVRDARAAASGGGPVGAGVSSRMFAKFRYGGRGSAPPPVKEKGEGDSMSILSKLAQELGMSAEEVKAAVRAEVVPISGEVEVTYPGDVRIVPTEKITVSPVVDGAPSEGVPAGLTFAMGDVAEGFTAEVDEGGVVTLTAPSGAEVGATAAFTVLVNDTAVSLPVTVRSLSEEDPAPADDGAAGEVVTVSKAFYERLTTLAALNAEREAEIAKRDREAIVNRWIAEGMPAAYRREALGDLEKDPEMAGRTWGTNFRGMVNRKVHGASKMPDLGEVTSKADKVAAHIAKANAQRQKRGN